MQPEIKTFINFEQGYFEVTSLKSNTGVYGMKFYFFYESDGVLGIKSCCLLLFTIDLERFEFKIL